MLVLARIICLIGGYFFGIIQTSYIYGKLHGIDIREYGSGNAGTTNALRVLGKKAGAVVFLGDLFKSVIACSVTHIIMNALGIENVYLFVIYTAAGVVLGHNFPFYMQFKGGKGIAVAVGCLVSTFGLTGTLLELAIFIILVVATKYVSVGSIAAAIACPFFALYFFGGNGIAIAVCLIAALTVIWAHRENIARLRAGNENKIGSKKTQS